MKASKLQASFSGGEFSPRVSGRVDSERYVTGAGYLMNYIPTTEGPLVRRGGFKYTGANVKDPSKPPAFLSFDFSPTQNYILEFGDFYVRFYVNNAQATTTSTHFKVSGVTGTANATFASSIFYAIRSSPTQNVGETILASSVIAAASILEIQSPYSYQNVNDLKYFQKEDTVYIVHSSYPVYKLQRFGNQLWDLKKINFFDGPYLAQNSYRTPGDSEKASIVCGVPIIVYQDGSTDYSATTGPRKTISGAANNGAGLIRITSSGHGKFTGDKVVILGVSGTTEANNGTSSISAMTWKVIKVDDNNIDLIGSTFSNAYVGSGILYPALWEPYNTNTEFSDVGRGIGLIRTDGGRAFGTITKVLDAARFQFHNDINTSPAVVGSSAANEFAFWYLGVWNRANGYPNAGTFHQDRLFFGGTPQYPQRLDASVTGEYENFQASGSSNIVSDNNALSFNLASDQLGVIKWLRSDTQGLLAGSVSDEWNITPSSQGAALTPTNFNAKSTSSYGSFNASPVKAGTATLYIQGSQRRVRELNYFFQVDTYRSTDLSELADHLTPPGLLKLFVQKEPVAVIWALKSDGSLVAMTYGRDDQTLKVGWSRHQLGGSSDNANTPPVIMTANVIPSPDGTTDQLWCAVKRFINGTSVVTIEYMADVFDEEALQEDAFHLDCGATYDAPITITNITNVGSAIVTAPSHALSNGDSVLINKVVGLNSSVTDISGVIHTSSLVNYHRFTVASASANAFWLQDFNSSFISANSYGAYFSGGEVRKLVSTISGLTWLKNETVDLLGDGMALGQVVVNSAGVIALPQPSAKVQIGYAYKSQGQSLRPEAGSRDGTSIGKMRRISRTAFDLHQIGDFKFGPSFDKLTPMSDIQTFFADQTPANTAAPLFTGIARDSNEAEFDFDGQVCWEQSSPLPGMVKAITLILEENDV